MTPTNHAPRSRVRRPRAGTRRGVLSTIPPPVVSSPEPVAAVVNRPKSTSIGSSIQHHARGIQSIAKSKIPRSILHVDRHPPVRARGGNRYEKKVNETETHARVRRRRRVVAVVATHHLHKQQVLECRAARPRVRARVDARFSQLRFLPLISLKIVLYVIVYNFGF